MLTTAKRFYSRMVSLLTALVMACTAAMFTVSTASGEDVSESKISEMVNEMAMQINAERRALGLKELYCVPYLMDCASIRADEVSVVWGHYRPNDDYFVSVIDYDIASYENIFENLTAGSETAADAMEQFRNSEKHWAAITNEEITHMGIGLVYNPEGYGGCRWYWTQIFLKDLRGDDYEYEGQYLPNDKVIVPADEGDINGDASINTFDYITLVEYIRNKQENNPAYLNDAQLEAADCFKDGRITEADAKAMMRYILGEYTALPFEF